MFWLGILCTGPFASLFCLLGLQEIARAHEAGIPLLVIGGIFLFVSAACAFQVLARQFSLLRVYREGIEIRTIGTPIQVDPILHILGFGSLVMLLIAFWHFVTLQMFRIRTVRLPWETVVVIPTKRTLAIAGWFDKENDNSFEDNPFRGNTLEDNSFEQETSSEYYAVSYDAHSFGTPIGKAIKTVQFFLFSADSRVVLPSWQSEETVLGNETFAFDQ